MKLDRLIASHQSMGRQAAHHAIAARRVRVDGVWVTDGHQPVDRFNLVQLDDAVIQPAERALYLMLHKPVGILSATKDDQHPTVVDLIDDPDKHTLHIAGRLDRSTSGLVLLTNDGRWSKRLMAAEEKVPKVYLVETLDPIAPDAVAAFAHGFYFHTEDITTLPAELVILDERHARLTLHEGRYHQVKRMFHRVSNRVINLHRESIGPLALPADLPPGAWRALTPQEVVAASGNG
ncbi:16S rRNA pseudouridine(516) synthase [Prosthecobacter sp.]|uniref:16S rRNA pseudouridine(516) synthase n=1 Tax=Prosthecobacter sp. TaxID=1965333 RepID=UPI0024888C92|nr:16S rRNA pseudouridine(516) synthase [Prosthecobacter sp.]MDI1313337.1 16S rRNA pseudouridine(516) synthase [Prosthecobacter sp.]